MALEARVLLDAAALETAGAVLDQAAGDASHSADQGQALLAALSGHAAVGRALPAYGGAPEILFVDSGVQDYAALVRDVGPGVEVHVLHGSDWSSQVEAVLGQRDGDVSAVHLVGHGSSGRLVLGGESIDAATLDSHARAWSAVRQALSVDGDLLLYGCDVGQGDAGLSFLAGLAERTGADVAASNDLTGISTLGGDWDLEVSSGEVATRSLYSESPNGFAGVLADGWVQDTEISAGKHAVAVTRTSDGKDFKFVSTYDNGGVVGTVHHGKVEVYQRTTSTGAWTLVDTLTHANIASADAGGQINPVGTIPAKFGFDIAAAGDKLVVAAPSFDPTTANAADGRVYIFTWNGTTWRSTTSTDTKRVQCIDYFAITGSGQTGVGGGSTNILASRGTADQWGYSVDIASDGSGNYRLVVGNPYEDWWEFDDGDIWDWNGWTQKERDDMGAAVVFRSSSHGQFSEAAANVTQIYIQDGYANTTDNYNFGGAVAAGWDQDNNVWWVAIGGAGTGYDQVRTYIVPAAGGTALTSASHSNAFTWDSSGPNDVSMHDDFMVIGNAASVQPYKLNAGSTAWSTNNGTATMTAVGFGNAVVSIVDRDTADGNSARMIYSGSGVTAVLDLAASGQFTPTGSISSRTEVAVALDRLYGLDLVMANGTSSQSWHYNWDPVGVADTPTISEDSTGTVINVLANDTDRNLNSPAYTPAITPTPLFGDVLAIVSATPVPLTSLGATVTNTSTTVTYNPSTSATLQALTSTQTATDTIVVTITDGTNAGGGTSTETVTITVQGVNDAPTTVGVPANPFRAQQNGTTVNYDLSSYFNDVDNGQDATLTLVKTAGSSWATISGQVLTLAIPAGYATTSETVTVYAQDANGATSSPLTFVFTIDIANNSPTVGTPIIDQVAVANYQFSYKIPTGTFVDADPAPYDTLTYSATLVGGGALPAWLTFDPLTQTFSGKPAIANIGTLNIRVTVADTPPAGSGRTSGTPVSDDFSLVIVNPTPHTPTAVNAGGGTDHNLGFSAAISENGQWMVVGAPGVPSPIPGSPGATIAGYVRIYEWITATSSWTQRGGAGGVAANIVAFDGAVGDFFGYSVSITSDGSKFIVGARGDDSGAGAAYSFTRTGTGTSTVIANTGKLQATGRAAGDRFGASVAVNGAGTDVVIGATHFDNGATDSGAVFYHANPFALASGSTTSLSALSTPTGLAAGDQFGTDVAFDQNIFVVSAISDDNPTGLIGQWKLDEGSGLLARAEFGGSNATLTGTLFETNATRGVVLRFLDGTSKMLMDAGTTLNPSWTVSSWYNGVTTAGGAGTYRTLIGGATDRQIALNNTDALGVVIGGTFTSSGYTLTAGEKTGWHLMTAVADGTRTRFYIDGVYKGTANVKSTDAVTAVGNRAAGNERFADLIDDLRVYDRALTESEVRNIYTGVAAPSTSFNNAGAVYVFSTSIGNKQVAKLYVPDGALSDYFGWTVDVDIYDGGVANQNGIIVIGSPYSDAKAADGGAVYIWRSDDLVSGGQHNNDPGDDTLGGNYATDVGRGTWDLEQRLTSFDTKLNDYFGYDVAVDYDETLGATRLVVGAPFEQAGGYFSGAVYAFKYMGNAVWHPEKFVDNNPQGGTSTNAAFFGNAVDVAIIDASNVRTVVGSRWRDVDALTTTNTNEGAVSWMNLLTQGWFTTLMTAETAADESYFLPASQDEVFALDTTATLGEVSFDEQGRLVYTAGSAFKSLGLGQTATDTFSYATEQGGTTVVTTVNIVVRGSGSHLDAYNDVIQVSAGAPVLLDVLANNGTADVVSTLQIQSVAAAGVQGQVTNTGTHLLYDPRGQFDALKAGESVQQTLTYVVRDAAGNEVTETVVVLVVGEDAPVVAEDDSASVYADATVRIDVLANDSDEDGDGTFRIESVDTSAALGTVYTNADGTLTYVPGAAFAYLQAGEVATDRIVYTVIDDTGNRSAAMLTVQVVGTDDAPQAVADLVTVASGAQVDVDVLANDRDPDGGSVEVVRVITTGTLGSVSINPDGTIRYVAAAGAPADRFSYEIVDDLGTTSIATVYVNQAADGTPVVVPVTNAVVDDVAVVRGITPVGIAIRDNDTGSMQSGGITMQPTRGQVSVVEGSAVVMYTPDASLASLPAGVVLTDSFQYTVQFADGTSATATVRVYINGTYAPANLEDEDRFAVLASRTLPVDAPLIVDWVAPADAGVPAADSVAQMALDGLVEMAEAEGEELAVAVSASSVRSAVSRPAFASLLGREAQARTAGTDALLRHIGRAAS